MGKRHIHHPHLPDFHVSDRTMWRSVIGMGLLLHLGAAVVWLTQPPGY